MEVKRIQKISNSPEYKRSMIGLSDTAAYSGNGKANFSEAFEINFARFSYRPRKIQTIFVYDDETSCQCKKTSWRPSNFTTHVLT